MTGMLILTRGLPGSGKTTEAMKWLTAHPGIRLNRDALRESLYGRAGVLDPAAEQSITLIQQTAARDALKSDQSVIVDDMNLRAKYARAWADLAVECGAGWEVMDLTDVPLEVCIDRDAARIARGERGVGEQVIRDLHAKFLAAGRLAPITPSPTTPVADVDVYVPRPDLPPAWLVDMDGTLAIGRFEEPGRRSPYDWARVGEDDPNEPVIELVDALCLAGQNIIVMSGRDSVCRADTEAWLKLHDVPWHEMHLRAEGDVRPDRVVKLELFNAHVRGVYDVSGVLDDRDSVVALWRSLGLMCAQVAPGGF